MRFAIRGKISSQLDSLFSERKAQVRGTMLEEMMNDLFRLDGVLLRESFVRHSQLDGRPVEQVDGVAELDSHVYLVELKW